MARAMPNTVPRHGLLSIRLLPPVFLLAVVGGSGWWLWRGRPATPENLPMMCKVERADFVHELTEQGTIESANNAEIRCEVKSNNMTGSVILDILPEGTMVEKGQEVAHLDSSALETDCTKQESVVATSEADLIKAKTAVETAELALKEYGKRDATDGTYSQLVNTANGELAVAEENLRRANQYLEYSERLYNKGYITETQLKADKFAIDKAENDRKVAQSKLDVLKNYTYDKQVQTLRSDIETAKAKLKSQENIHKLECTRLAFIKDQIAKCALRAPCAGQVVYANTTNQWGDKTTIETGVTVRERQPVIRLPDRTQMLVKVKINESKIALVRAKQSATIRMDALPDSELSGTVEKVEEYPLPNKWFASAVKEYETTVRVHNAPDGMRPGLTAQVTVRVERSPSVLQVPVQAVIEHGTRHYCVLWKDDRPEAREVTIGSTNDKTVVLRQGLGEGEQVVLNAGACRGKLSLPELPAEPSLKTMIAEASSPKPGRLGKSASAQDQPGKPHEYALASVAKPMGDPGVTADQLLRDYGKGDKGQVKLADLPEKVRSGLAGADANGDGVISRAELDAALTRRPQAREAKVETAAHP
jgi:RND family efflux transporter MFP subunit